MDTVKVECFQNLQQVVTAGSHALISDEPSPAGDDLGSNPYALSDTMSWGAMMPVCEQLVDIGIRSLPTFF